MATAIQELAVGIPVSLKTVLPGSSSLFLTNSTANELSRYNQPNSMLQKMNKLGKKADLFAIGLQTRVRLNGMMISETVKGKLRWGARILRFGGINKVFRRLFSVKEGEKLLKASQCYLSTTSGPIAGILFITTQRLAFCSERTLRLFSPDEESHRIYYKVVIPLTKLDSANQCESASSPSEKYLQITTVDNFEFWFMGILSFQRTFKCIQQLISQEASI